ncbi:MAG: glycolate oxidase subunit GlcF [Rhodospirillales bacterium]|jgi:glycolate oxidase iron-sulfur subunit|nr:glycolate oxidase subunit GlcF [Rhodospirillales bacterium]MBT5077120.1 glycolate oxidase subunit GlcF [Rhodospirillales bacterium]MBT5113753.1 glycolate oxidase subunit GlcF [Rhodospirillales bacterium]MBT5672281.1 glycolate oxidase subunit GlcF [Rhodospirillales bacterium]MBT6187052.1 glycolate oxidase subunit GlcF [Rhodospirillales bacterium]
MRTDFTEQQLNDPRIAAANDILRACVHCGFCAPVCPTYQLTGDELDGPRGRIWQMRDVLESDGPVPLKTITHLDRCLGCLACMPACPSGVDYGSLLNITRAITETDKTRVKRSLSDQWVRGFLNKILPSPKMFAWVIVLARLLGPLHKLFGGSLLGRRLRSALARLDRPLLEGDFLTPGIYETDQKKRGRMAMIPGCVQSVLAPNINGAMVRILNRAGFDVVILDGTPCCGAISEHLGRADDARNHAKTIIARIEAEMAGAGVDGIIQTASGCGTAMKHYGDLFADDPMWQTRASLVAGMVRDGGEFIEALDGFEDGLDFRADLPPLRVAWQAPCSLAFGQGVAGRTAGILMRAGFEVVAPDDGGACCGSAGTYNILKPGLAKNLGVKKAVAIAVLRPDVVASANLGCMLQLEPEMDAPIVHVVSLLDWALGGPVPQNLKPVIAEKSV